MDAERSCFPWGNPCTADLLTPPSPSCPSSSSSLLPSPAFRGRDQGHLKASEDQVGARHSPVGDTATGGESPAAVPWGSSPGPCSWETPCHGYLSHRTERAENDKVPEQGQGVPGIVPAARHVTTPREVKQKGGRACSAWHEDRGSGALEMRNKMLGCTHRDQSIAGGMCQGTNSSCHGHMAGREQQTGKRDTETGEIRKT